MKALSLLLPICLQFFGQQGKLKINAVNADYHTLKLCQINLQLLW